MKTTGKRQRQGLTLIELIVVLVILVGLAAIIIPMLPSMITRTHGAAGATNIGEVAKWVQTFEALNYSYPNSWDALVKDDGSEPKIGADEYFELGAHMEVSATGLTAAQANSLSEAGINSVHYFQDDPDHATFSPYASAVTSPTAVAAGVRLVSLTADGIVKLNLEPTGQYVVLGLGSRNSMIGKTVADAPVHFPDNPDDDPSRFYSRFGVVFKVNVGRALPVAVVAFHHDGELTTLGDHVAEYFEAVNNK
jgi:prepilin-type N-terminal cleavage/methylation domain-containing protein